MKRIAKFHRVSEGQFAADFKEAMPGFTDSEIRDIYSRIKLPRRATVGSAGYDFYSPFTFNLRPGEGIRVPTGIRAEMEDGWVLQVYPKSGLGFKYRLQLNNTIGIIDSDYFHADNEGHIIAQLTNDSRAGRELRIEHGMGIIQGVFMEYGITTDDETSEIRHGGFGSTEEKR